MAEETTTFEVIFAYASTGVAKSEQEIVGMQEALAKLNQAGKLSEGQFRDASRALGRMARAFAQGRKDVDNYGEGFKKLIADLDEAQKKFRETAQAAAVGGSKTPLNNSAVPNLAQARQNIATEEARTASVLSASRKVVAAHEQEIASQQRLNQSVKEGAAAVRAAQTDRAYEKELAALTPLEAATRRVADARRELYNANRQVSRAQASGDLEKQTQALQRQEKAVRSAAAAESILRKETTASAAGTSDLSSNLPRLRYALYDVSSAFTLAGAAVLGLSIATAATAISMDKDFADVRRTTGTAGFAARELRKDFDDLFTSLPIKWDALTQIGTLAGQLNIASGDVSEFTELVAKFSATTDVSVEQSATAFGRLSQLLNVSSKDYSRLGSSILGVGVNSVATESQIIAISTQIAGVARQANLSASEVFGLSAALASLGIQPELARGTVTRLFTNIEVAVSNGGSALDRFASVSGRTASDFQNSWGSDSSGVLLDFFRGLDRVEKSGGSAIATLRELGITSVRDVPALLRLAQSSDMVAESVAIANKYWEENTALNDQFNVVATTVGAKLEIIANKFTKLVDSLGTTAAGAHVVVDALGFILDVLNKLAQNPIISGFAGFALVLGAVAGALSLVIGLVARGAATFLALRTAQLELTHGTGGLSSAVAAFTAIMHGNTVAVVENTAAKTGNAAATNGLAGANARGVASTNKFTSALGKAGLVGSILLAIPLLAELAGLVSDWATSGSRDILGLNKTTEEYVNLLGSASEGLTGLDGKITQQLSFLSSFGNDFDFGDFLIFGPSGMAAFTAAEAEIQKVDAALAQLAQKGNAAFATKQVDAYVQALVNGGMSAEAARGLFSQTFDVIGDGSIILQQQADATQEATDALEDRLESVLSTVDENNKLNSSLQSLGDVFRESGAVAADSSSEMLAVIRQIFAMDPSSAANNLQGLFNIIVQGGYASAAQLTVLRQAIVALGGATGNATIDVAALFNQMVSGATKGGRAAGGAARQVRTLVDYASDLEKVWSRAFDIRFGAQSALDDVTASWQDLNDEIADYQQKVLELTANRNIQEYFLSVAEAYGDTLRAGKIRAEIADIDNDLADATAGASKELTGNSKAAIGNRKRILDLVSGYQDYLKSLAESGASTSTLSAAVNQSKADFLAQATALGYSTAQLQPYIRSFDDMTVAINNVPRNITVTANINPALQALNEFVAKARTAGGSAGSVLGTTFAQEYKTAFERYMAQRPIAIQGYLIQGQQVYRVPGTQLKLYDRGGFTGPGAKMTPAGVVHRGEYVIPKKDVNQRTGLPYADALGRLQSGTIARNSYAGGGYVRGAGMVNINIPSPMEVQLSASDRRLLQAVGGSGDLFMDGRLVTDVVNNNNSNSSRRGA